MYADLDKSEESPSGVLLQAWDQENGAKLNSQMVSRLHG